MANRANYAKIGLFVVMGLLGALALAVGLGTAHSQREKVAIYTYLDEWQQRFSKKKVAEQHDSPVAPPADAGLPGSQRPGPAAT